MFDKMRWYMIAFWILLTLSVLHFALAVPVAVGETREVRSNSLSRDGTAAWEKRMEPIGRIEEQIDAKGIKERGYEWPGEWDLGLPYDDPPKVNIPPKVKTVGGNGNGNGAGGHATAQSSQGSAENMRPGPQSEHPPTPDLMTSLKNWFKGPVSDKLPKIFRPRNLEPDANAVRATSANSAHDLPGRRQQIPDKLD